MAVDGSGLAVRWLLSVDVDCERPIVCCMFVSCMHVLGVDRFVFSYHHSTCVLPEYCQIVVHDTTVQLADVW